MSNSLPRHNTTNLFDTSLIFADDVKQRLLNYIQTTLIYSDANVDFNIISWNRSVTTYLCHNF